MLDFFLFFECKQKKNQQGLQAKRTNFTASRNQSSSRWFPVPSLFAMETKWKMFAKTSLFATTISFLCINLQLILWPYLKGLETIKFKNLMG